MSVSRMVKMASSIWRYLLLALADNLYELYMFATLKKKEKETTLEA